MGLGSQFRQAGARENRDSRSDLDGKGTSMNPDEGWERLKREDKILELSHWVPSLPIRRKSWKAVAQAGMIWGAAVKASSRGVKLR